MSNYSSWNKKQGEAYIKELSKLIVKIPDMGNYNFVVYKITVNTPIGVYTYIGQTKILIIGYCNIDYILRL